MELSALPALPQNNLTSDLIYTELSGLRRIQQAGAQNTEKALRMAAQQFESMFIKIMLQAMRSASDTLNEDGLFDSSTSEFYQQMYDDQLALTLSKQGVGLADTIYQQMISEYRITHNQKIPPNTEGNPADKPHEFIEKHNATEKFSSAYGNHKNAKFNVQNESKVHKVWRPATPLEFVKDILPYAKSAATELGVELKAIIAQAALETGWGQHVMTATNGDSSFNIFGIKADQRWQGNQVVISTLEYISGLPDRVISGFRQYESLSAAFSDYVAFLKNSQRYQDALATESVAKFSEALQQGGYATDPHYAAKITEIAQRSELDQWLYLAESMMAQES